MKKEINREVKKIAKKRKKMVAVAQVENLLKRAMQDLEKAKKISHGAAEVSLTGFPEGLEAKIKERTHELSVLYEFSNAISYTLDYQQLLKLVMESLFKIVDYDICVSLLFDKNVANVTVKPSYPESAKFIEEAKNAIVASTSMLTGEDIKRKHLTNFLIPSVIDIKPKEGREFDKLRSSFNVPFIVQGKTVGMINVSSCRENVFGEEEIKLISTIINQASTAIERLRAVITAEKSKMESMVEGMTEGVIMLDEQGEIVVFNPQAKEMLGFGPKEEITGGLLNEKMKAFKLDEAFEECKNTKHLITKEIAIVKDDPSVLRCDITPVKDIKEEVTGIVAILRDITKEKEVDKMKTEFISTVSHELRTPLTTMREFISIISDEIPGKLSKEQRDYVDIIRSNIDRLARLINDLLDISKIESGKIELKKTFITLPNLVKNVIAALKPKASHKHIELKLSCQAFMSRVYIDTDRIVQVFTNLIENAIKFTPERGKVTVKIINKEKELECSVADTGAGIAPENLSKVFGRFQQFGRIAGPGAKGTGLGLAIAKELVEMHNGRIWVESELGRSTTFLFTLPKDTIESLFKKMVHDRIEEAVRLNSKMSVITISIIDFSNLKRQLDSQKLRFGLLDIERVLRYSLRLPGDTVLRDDGEIFIILEECGKENALTVESRLERAIADYLKREELAEEIKLRFGSITYPDEAKNAEELFGKAKKSQQGG